MFDNIGNKILCLARFLCIMGIIGSVIYGIALIVNGAAISGFMYILVGPLVSWLSCFVLYGFGQLIETNESSMNMIKNIGLMIEDFANKNIEQKPLQTDENMPDHAENLAKLKKLYDIGAITEDEYEKTKAALLRKFTDNF